MFSAAQVPDINNENFTGNVSVYYIINIMLDIDPIELISYERFKGTPEHVHTRTCVVSPPGKRTAYKNLRSAYNLIKQMLKYSETRRAKTDNGSMFDNIA